MLYVSGTCSLFSMEGTILSVIQCCHEVEGFSSLHLVCLWRLSHMIYSTGNNQLFPIFFLWLNTLLIWNVKFFKEKILFLWLNRKELQRARAQKASLSFQAVLCSSCQLLWCVALAARLNWPQVQSVKSNASSLPGCSQFCYTRREMSWGEILASSEACRKSPIECSETQNLPNCSGWTAVIEVSQSSFAVYSLSRE